MVIMAAVNYRLFYPGWSQIRQVYYYSCEYQRNILSFFRQNEENHIMENVISTLLTPEIVKETDYYLISLNSMMSNME